MEDNTVTLILCTFVREIILQFGSYYLDTHTQYVFNIYKHVCITDYVRRVYMQDLYNTIISEIGNF